MAKDRESKSVPKVKLTKAEKKQLAKIMAQAKKPKHPQTTQQTIPYQRMWPDGICRVTDHYYTKTIQFYDINYSWRKTRIRKPSLKPGAMCSITSRPASGSSFPL